jgi:prolipoprotein diacylglyceryltransferase
VGPLTGGQILALVMIAIGLLMLSWALRSNERTDASLQV